MLKDIIAIRVKITPKRIMVFAILITISLFVGHHLELDAEKDAMSILNIIIIPLVIWFSFFSVKDKKNKNAIEKVS